MPLTTNLYLSWKFYGDSSAVTVFRHCCHGNSYITQRGETHRNIEAHATNDKQQLAEWPTDWLSPWQANSSRQYWTFVFIITVWTVVQAVLTATFNSYGDRQISTPYKINTPEPIDKIFGTVDYVREGTLYQIWYKFTHWGLLGKWVKYNKKYFLFIPFFSSVTRTGQTRGWIFTRDSSKDVKSRKDVPFGGLNDVPLNFGGKTH